MVVQILCLNSQQQRSEPLERPEISANPEEVDFTQAGAALRVVHPVPDTLQDGSEGRDTDTCTDEDGDLEFEHVFGGGAKGAVYVDAGEDLAEGDFGGAVLVALFAFALFEVATEGFAEGFGEVADHADVHGDVVFFGGAGEGEGVVLPDGDFGAAEEDVLGVS